jgi:ABC-type spermidine/putrescine transport system permease subunit II
VHILVGLVFGVWITSATFRSIPNYLEEAARSVGASRLYTFFHITLPLAAPGLLASAVFVFITSLDEFTGTFFIGLLLVLLHLGNVEILEMNSPEAAAHMDSGLLTLASLLIFGGRFLFWNEDESARHYCGFLCGDISDIINGQSCQFRSWADL